MLSQELVELQMRCIKAVQDGQQLAKGVSYADTLTKQAGKVDMEEETYGSPAHLLILIKAIEDGRKVPDTMKVEAPKPVVEEPKVVEAPNVIEEPVLSAEEPVTDDVPVVEVEEPKKKSKKSAY
jgi:hypothetical protein